MSYSSENVQFPTIDLAPYLSAPFPGDPAFPSPQQRAVARTVDACFRGIGLLFIRNIPVTPSSLRALNEVSARLFAPDDNSKRSSLLPMLSGTNMGYLPFNVEGLNTLRGPDIKETYNFQFGANIDQDFRGCPTGFIDTARDFWDALTVTAKALCIVCSVALELPVDYFLSALKTNQSSTIRLLHYPPCTMPPPATNSTNDGAIRAGEHTDFGLFTFLFTDGPGLQVRENLSSEFDFSNRNKWIDVPQPQGTDTIVVLGALMSRWTNDNWPAAAHRVIVHDEQAAKQDRLTIACFYQPDPDFMVSVHPKFIPKSQEAKYEPISAKEYLLHRLTQANASVPS